MDNHSCHLAFPVYVQMYLCAHHIIDTDVSHCCVSSRGFGAFVFQAPESVTRILKEDIIKA